MTNPQVKVRLDVKDDLIMKKNRMISFMKVKVDNERSRIIATNRQKAKDNRMET